MDAVEGSMPGELPRAPLLHPAPWRIPETGPGFARPGLAARALLHRLLLGVDAAVVRGRRDEPRLDRGACRPGAVGESDDRWSRHFARGRHRPGHRRGGARPPALAAVKAHTLTLGSS